MKKLNEMTKEELWKIFEYKEGDLYWKPIEEKDNNDRAWNGSNAGRKAGYKNGKTIVINYKTVKTSLNKLIYKMFHDVWSKFVIHLDKNRLNCRIENLKEVDGKTFATFYPRKKKEKVYIKETQEELIILLDYANGNLIWKQRHPLNNNSNKAFNATFPGKIAGKINAKKSYTQRYITLNIKGKTYYYHKVIWKWHHGDEPEEVDHINGNSFDNRIENLRATTTLKNRKNRTRQSDSTTGIIGVRKMKNGKYAAFIQVDKKSIRLGTFFDIEEAKQARLEAQNKYHGEWAGSLEARPWSFS